MFSACLFIAENASASIENNISATANTGGNTIKGNGTIKTGDATAQVQAENYVNGEESTQNKVEARAEVQGEGAEASVEANGEKKSCVAESDEGCAVEISGTNPADNLISEPGKADKNMIQAVAGAIADFAKNITDKIFSWFS